MLNPNNINIKKLNTYLDYPHLPHRKLNFVQNSLELKNYKLSLSLDVNLINIIRGGLLGDLTGIRKLNTPTNSLKVEQKLDKKEYVDHLYYVLYPFVGTPPSIRNIQGGGAKDRQSYWFRTYGHSELEKIIKPFYQFDSQLNKLVKIVPADIGTWLNPQVLAYFFMDDGSKTKKNYYLNTQGFTFEDQLKIQEALLNLDVKSSVKKDKISKNKVLYKLEINEQSNNVFVNLLKPYILPVFMYKLN